MKFRDGYWGLKPGITLHRPIEVRDTREADDSLVVYASARPFNHRGDTLNTPVITTELTSPMQGVIHVHTYRWKGAQNRPPFFVLQADASVPVEIARAETSATFRSGELSVTVPTHGERGMEFAWSERHLTSSRPRLSGHVTLPDGAVRMSEHLGLSVGETVYGLGERFTPFVKNGQVVDVWNEDGGTSSEQAYKNIPFYLTSRGYGVLVANPGDGSFEVGSEVVTSVQFSVPGEFLDYYLIAGDTPMDVLRTYTRLTGRPALPPPWSFGLWLTTSFTTSYDEETVSSFVDGMAEREIPLRVFHFDCFWMKEFQWVDFQWDTEMFPDPKGMLHRLKQKGLNICVWINPYVAQKSPLFDEGMANGYLVKNPDGSVWQWDRWQAGMGLVDFTNPRAVSWYQSMLRDLLEMGVDTFKTDFGERIPVDVVYHDGSDPVKMHNYYSYLYNKAVFDVVEDVRGKADALVFARSATVGGQRFPVHWGGDSTASYESMAESLRGGLSLALSGFGFWSHDIGGFEQTATADLFKRWVAFGLLSTHSRLHGSESYRVPWNFDDESNDVLRFFVNLKCTLMPYLFAEASRTATEGIPMMRAMALEFPEDPTCAPLDREYMLGETLLVAPVFAEDGNVTYYVPHGSWTSLISGDTVEGGCWHTERHDYLSLPLLVRPNSIVAMGANDQRPDYDYADGVTFHVFQLEPGSKASAFICDPNGAQAMSVSAQRIGDRVTVRATGAQKPWKLCLRGIAEVTVETGGTAASSAHGALVEVTPGETTVVVRV